MRYELGWIKFQLYTDPERDYKTKWEENVVGGGQKSVLLICICGSQKSSVLSGLSLPLSTTPAKFAGFLVQFATFFAKFLVHYTIN